MKLHKYQEDMFNFLVEQQSSCALFVRMGLGKTLPTLTYLEYLKTIGELTRVLIVAPRMVAIYTWPNEIKKWGFSFHYRQLAGHNTIVQRSRVLNQNKDFEMDIINIDLLPWLMDQGGFSYDIIIVDEISAFKDHTSERFKKFKKFIRNNRNIKVIGLTGTPAPNNLIQLWPMIYLLDCGSRLGKNISYYRDTYFFPVSISFSRVVMRWGMREGADQMIYGKLKDIVYCINDTSILDTPPLIDIPYLVHLDQDVKTKYKLFKNSLILDIDNIKIDGINGGVLISKLIQFNSGSVYDENNYVHHIHQAKMDALKEILQFIEDDHVLIVYWFKHEKDRLIKEGYPELDIDKWNKGEQPIAIIHPASCGHGLNLQSGGSVFIWFTLTWSLELYEQTIARLLRQGQKNPVRNYKLIIPNTIDEGIVDVLAKKQGIQNALMDALQLEEKWLEAIEIEGE